MFQSIALESIMKGDPKDLDISIKKQYTAKPNTVYSSLETKFNKVADTIGLTQS